MSTCLKASFVCLSFVFFVYSAFCVLTSVQNFWVQLREKPIEPTRFQNKTPSWSYRECRSQCNCRELTPEYNDYLRQMETLTDYFSTTRTYVVIPAGVALLTSIVNVVSILFGLCRKSVETTTTLFLDVLTLVLTLVFVTTFANSDWRLYQTTDFLQLSGIVFLLDGGLILGLVINICLRFKMLKNQNVFSINFSRMFTPEFIFIVLKLVNVSFLTVFYLKKFHTNNMQSIDCENDCVSVAIPEEYGYPALVFLMFSIIYFTQDLFSILIGKNFQIGDTIIMSFLCVGAVLMNIVFSTIFVTGILGLRSEWPYYDSDFLISVSLFAVLLVLNWFAKVFLTSHFYRIPKLITTNLKQIFADVSAPVFPDIKIFESSIQLQKLGFTVYVFLILLLACISDTRGYVKSLGILTSLFILHKIVFSFFEKNAKVAALISVVFDASIVFATGMFYVSDSWGTLSDITGCLFLVLSLCFIYMSIKICKPDLLSNFKKVDNEAVHFKEMDNQDEDEAESKNEKPV